MEVIRTSTSERTVSVAVVGCGHWGRNHLRVFNELPLARVTAASDPSAPALDWTRRRYPGVRVTADPEAVARDPDVDAVVLACPATLHAPLARLMLDAGKHVLVEKPLAGTSRDAWDLVRLARDRRRVLMTGHTFLYNNSVRLIRQLVRRRAFGRVYYLTARRNHMGLIREDVSALWDLAAHDISIFMYLLDAAPVRVACMGASFLREGRADAAFLTLEFPGGVLGHVQVSWLDAAKVREVVVIGDRERILFDDLSTMEPVRVFKRGVSAEPFAESFGDFKYLVRDGHIVSPTVRMQEPLKVEADEFVQCITKGRRPLCDGELGARVVAVLEAADASMKKGGSPLEVPSDPH